MIAKLSTTIEKIKNLPNSTNSITLNEFLMYMKNRYRIICIDNVLYNTEYIHIVSNKNHSLSHYPFW
jgi:hypothetical protein